jgi:hypothetical protein
MKNADFNMNNEFIYERWWLNCEKYQESFLKHQTW